MYNILQVHIEYKNGRLFKVTVLVEISKGDIRAIFSTVVPKAGYDYLQPGEPVNDALFQRVAGYGCQTSDYTVFPNWKN